MYYLRFTLSFSVFGLSRSVETVSITTENYTLTDDNTTMESSMPHSETFSTAYSITHVSIN